MCGKKHGRLSPVEADKDCHTDPARPASTNFRRRGPTRPRTLSRAARRWSQGRERQSLGRSGAGGLQRQSTDWGRAVGYGSSRALGGMETGKRNHDFQGAVAGVSPRPNRGNRQERETELETRVDFRVRPRYHAGVPRSERSVPHPGCRSTFQTQEFRRMTRKTSLKQLLSPIAILAACAAIMAFRPLPMPSNADDWCLAGYPAGSLTCCACPVDARRWPTTEWRPATATTAWMGGFARSSGIRERGRVGRSLRGGAATSHSRVSFSTSRGRVAASALIRRWSVLSVRRFEGRLGCRVVAR